MNISIVYMVAGLSSRFGGKIKQFVKVGRNDETLIEHSMNQALKAGFNKIVFIVGEKTEKPFKEMFGEKYNGIPIEYGFQEYDSEKRDKPWGTCDAVCSAMNKIKEPFVVCTGDDIYGEKTFKILVNHLNNNEEENATISKNLIEMLPKKGTVNRGIFKVGEENNVIEMEEVEKINRKNFKEMGFEEKTPTSISIFALNPKTLKLLKEKLDKFKEENRDSKEVECYLNVVLGELIKENKMKMKIYCTEEKWLGVTNPEDEFIIKQKLK